MSEVRNVLHLTTTGAIAGAEQLLVDLSRVHNRQYWNVGYATLFSAGEMNAKIEGSGALCYAFDANSVRRLPLATLKIAEFIRREKIDILHTHLVHAGLIGLFAARLSGSTNLKLVHTRHHSDELHRFGPPYKAKVDGWMARHHEIVCANSLAAKAVLIDLEGVAPERVRLNYPGVDLDILHERVRDKSGQAIRGELGFSSGDVVIGSVSHLLPKKGHQFLLRAFALVVAHRANARLVIVGRGIERENLESLVKQLNLSHFVRMTGYRADVPEFINSFDFTVQPSLEEAFGVAMVEGMALGKPVIGSDVGGIPEVVIHQVTGLLSPPGDVEKLASAIISLIDDSAMRQRMGMAGKDRAEQRFNIRLHATTYEAVWSELLAR